jgi:hypothetical protein
LGVVLVGVIIGAGKGIIGGVIEKGADVVESQIAATVYSDAVVGVWQAEIVGDSDYKEMLLDYIGLSDEEKIACAQIEAKYVLNTKSQKFHKPDCGGLKNMNPENRENYEGSRADLVKLGYTPCGTCKP